MGIFGGGKSEKPAASTTTRPSVSQPVSSNALSAKSRAAAPTVIGRNAKITGEISSDEDMLIEGRVDGKIRSSKLLIIGESGDVKADLEAEIVSVRGTVNGNCSATGKVEIASTGSVFGNIEAPAIAVAEGATFRGASKTSDKTRRAKPPRPSPAAPPISASSPETIKPSPR